MRNEAVLDYCAEMLHTQVIRHNKQHRVNGEKVTLNQVKELLKNIDKYLFLRLRDGEITLD